MNTIPENKIMFRSHFLLIILLVICVCQTIRSQDMQVFPTEFWALSDPKSQGIDSARLQIALDTLQKYCHGDGLNETIIIRNGYVVYQGDSVQNTHSIWSCSKSFTTTVLGLLIQNEACKLDDYAATYEPLLKEKYPSLKLRHMANMTSGYSAVGDDRWDDWESEDWSWTPYRPASPYSEPGTTFQYWDENMMMFGRVLTQIAKRPKYEILKEAITDKIGFGDWYWSLEKDIKGMPINNGCTDIHINATQLARMGLLFLNKGNWDGEQLLDSEWVEMATTLQAPITLQEITDNRNITGRGGYGFGWWVKGEIGDMPDTPAGTFYMSGFNNNVCFVIPEWNLVFVRMGRDGNPEEGKRNVYNRFIGELKKAIKK